MKYKQQNGFTLMEVIITLVIVAIVAAYAAPAIQSMVERNKVRAHLNSFASSLLLARSEAAARGFAVTVCAADVAEFLPEQGITCSLAASDYSDGWIVFPDYGDGNSIEPGDPDGIRNATAFYDLDGDGLADDNPPAAENVLAVSAPADDRQRPDRLVIQANISSFTSSISYNASGNAGANGSFKIFKANESDKILGEIKLNATGRPYICLDGPCP